MRYFVYYDNNGVFLGGLSKSGKPSKKGYKEVKRDEYINILKLNGMPADIEGSDTKAAEETVTETEETVTETTEEA